MPQICTFLFQAALRRVHEIDDIAGPAVTLGTTGFSPRIFWPTNSCSAAAVLFELLWIKLTRPLLQDALGKLHHLLVDRAIRRR